ncbi:hypothetical protein Hanom_Chr13g01216581 [Helianthus anomalus]
MRVYKIENHKFESSRISNFSNSNRILNTPNVDDMLLSRSCHPHMQSRQIS